MSTDEAVADPPEDPPRQAETPAASLNPNANSFSFNPNVPSFEFKPVMGGTSIQRLPSVCEDQIHEPEGSPEPAEGETGEPQTEEEWEGDGEWEEQTKWAQTGEWTQNSDGEWVGEDGMVWQEDECGYYDENDQWQEYGFSDYLDDKGEYWLENPNMPAGMLGGAPWPRRGDRGHDRSHWHQSGTSSASTSPYTQATLQGAVLQPWCGKIVLPTKQGESATVKKYNTDFLLQFQNKCTTTPANLPGFLMPPISTGPPRSGNTPYKNKNRAPGSDRSTLILDGMAGRADLYNQQDLHVPQRPKQEKVVTYNQDFLLGLQHMPTSGTIPGFTLPNLPGITAAPGTPQTGPPIPSLLLNSRGSSCSGSRKSNKKPKGGTGNKVAPRSKFPNSIFKDHPQARTAGHKSSSRDRDSPFKQAPVFDGPVEPLQQSQNRWVRPDKAKQDETEVLRKKVLSILNKMTPEKFDRLLVQLLEIQISCKETMSMVIGSIFDKAVAEPAYATMYAELCSQFSAATPQVEQHGESHTFKRMLLKKCYDNFMNEAEDEEPDQFEDEDEDEAEDRFNQAKKRMLGNVTLIGELFKKGLLTENIIKICITLLLEESLEEPDYRDIEALCLLLSIVGPLLGEYVESIMPQITELSGSSLLPSRMRFMLQGVLELRKASWVPRREKTITPKKLKEVRQSAAAQSLQRTSSYQSPFMNKQRRQQGLKPRATPSPSSHATMTRSFSDGHAAVMVDPALVKDLRERRKGNLTEAAATNVSSNGGVTLERNDSRERGFSEWEAPTMVKGLTTIATQPNIQAKISFNPQNSSSDITQPPSGFHKPCSPPGQSVPMDAALFEKKLGSILDEFLASSDEKEAKECVAELSPSEDLLCNLSSNAVVHVMEKKPADRSKVDGLLLHLSKDKLLKPEHIVASLTLLMEQMPDLEMDVPMYARYIATTMAVFVGNQCMSPGAIKDIFADMVGTSHAPKVVIPLFDEVVTAHGLEKAQKMFCEVQLPGLDFLPADDKGEEGVQKWLKRAKCRNDMTWMFAT
eukprot:TRINITY_DN23566_c0_g1_i2.p1 TRINITY_DN23566_c0_g1~~TRINITY_DN23566_c0_g1_i2.p1  ORF type:complete len:1031 (+),score=225.09 TRINITY_DN23566_c0_g1_i2:236-3328(+)